MQRDRYAYLLKKSISVFFLGLGFALTAQNLIPNPSFEEKRSCPVDFNQGSLQNLSSWTQAGRGTTDYFHSCSRNMGVPENVFGEQEAKDGEAYLGLIAYTPTKRNYREYMQVELTQPLSAGEKYCFTMYVCLAEGSRFSMDGLGALLSTAAIKSDGQSVLRVEPQLKNPKGYYLDGTDEWLRISDVITANGGERWLTVGNFLADDKLNVRKRNLKGSHADNPWEHSYYFVDDMSLVPVETASECRSTLPLLAKMAQDKERWSLSPGEQVKLDHVLFPFDGDELDAIADERLTDVASLMLANPFLYLEVHGHTDIIGPDGYNLGLSERRAEVVLAFLKGLGVPKSRLSMSFHGEEKPVADNQEESGRSLNRRVEFTIYERKAEDYLTTP